MYLLALAVDYDETIAHHGKVDAPTREALHRLKETGRRLFLVTGRELADLKTVHDDLAMFDRVVAENGAVIYDPAADEERTIAPPPSPLFIEALRAKNVKPLSVGKCIVATCRPHENAMLEAVRDLGLEVQIIFNKGAVMALPTGINKAEGLLAALADFKLSPHNVIAAGDGENDDAFLSACGVSAAVANAVPLLKNTADIVLESPTHGVVELIKRICAEDASLVSSPRHGIRVGAIGDRDHALLLAPNTGSVLITGGSGAGESTLATALTERMAEKKFEFCVFDPEGDYCNLDHAVSIGGAKSPPDKAEIMQLVEKLGVNVVINAQALALSERPAFFAALLPDLCALRARTGRPHWLLIDEAHHLVPAQRAGLGSVLPKELPATILITVHPEAVSAQALRAVRHVIASGAQAAETIASFCRAIDTNLSPSLPSLDRGKALFYSVGGEAQVLIPDRPHQARPRHARKYAEGDLGPDRSFLTPQRAAGSSLKLYQTGTRGPPSKT